MSDIRALTGLRGVAALWVVVYHIVFAGAVAVAVPWAPLEQLIRHGYLAVDVFFALSGFVMALSYGRYVQAGWTWRSYADFMRRRLARVYPLYLVMTLLVAAMLATGLSRSLASATLGHDLPYNLLLIQSWGLAESINPPAWSISTELAAYVLFPLLAWPVFRLRLIWPLLLAGVAAGGLYLLQYVSLSGVYVRYGPLDIVPEVASPWAVMRCLGSFTLGLVMHRLSLQPWVRQHVIERTGVAGLVALLMLICAATAGADILFVLLAPLLVLTLLNERALLSRWLASPALYFLGEISYSVYLLHAQLLRVTWMVPPRLAPWVGELPAFLIGCGIMFAILLGMSYLSYRFLEKPCRAWLSGRKS